MEYNDFQEISEVVAENIVNTPIDDKRIFLIVGWMFVNGFIL